MEKFHAYIRVSTETQTVDRQKDLIQHFCESYPGVEVEYYIDEGWSGDLPPAKRKALSRCIDDAMQDKRRGGKGHILLSDFFRFSRNIGHSCTFLTDVVKKNKVSLLIADQKFMVDLEIDQQISILKGLAQRAEDYREDNSIKTKQGLQAINREIEREGFYTAKRSGRVIYKLGLHDNMDYARQKASEKVKSNKVNWAKEYYTDIKLRLDAGKSYRDIVREFNEKKHFERPRQGAWHPSTIANIVKTMKGVDHDFA